MAEIPALGHHDGFAFHHIELPPIFESSNPPIRHPFCSSIQVKDQPLKDEEATMEKLGISPYRKLWAETRKEGQDWQPVEQAELLVHVRMYSPASDEIEPHRVVGIGTCGWWG